MCFNAWSPPLRWHSRRLWPSGASRGDPALLVRYTTYQNCPLPTPEDRLLCILVYLKTCLLQVVQGRLSGMGQSKAHQWLHVLLVVLQATLRTLGMPPPGPWQSWRSASG